MDKNALENYKKDCFEYQRAIKLLVDSCLDSDGSQKNLETSKPLVMHSLRIALRLIETRERHELVTAAILHDLIEDAGVTKDEISARFGNEVADIVEAMTYDPHIDDEIEKGRALSKKALAHGSEILKIKVLDGIDNMKNYVFTPEDESRKAKVFVRWGEFVQTMKKKASSELAIELANAYIDAKMREKI